MKDLMALRKVAPNALLGSDHAEFFQAILEHGTAAKNYLLDGTVIPKFDAAVSVIGEQFSFVTSKSRLGITS